MKGLYFILLLALSVGFTQTTNAQFWDKLKKQTEKKVKSEGEKRVQDKVNKGVEKGYDEVEKGVKGEGNEKSKDNTKNPPAQTNTNVNQPSAESNLKAEINSKYDFIPGEKVVFFDDFTAENIGDYPIQWNTTGSGEVVTTNLADGRWFYITNGNGITTLMDPVLLPDNCTIEFDLIPVANPKNNKHFDFNFYIIGTPKPNDLKYGLARPGGDGIKFTFGYSNYYAAYYSDGTPNMSGMENEPKLKADNKYRISIWKQKERLRLYIGQNKLFDLPRVMSKNVKYNMIRFDSGTPMITNLRIATGLPDMRSKLLTEGKLISYGIYFDVNKDVVKPESYPSIKEIAAILKDNQDVRIKIVGHTDSDGDNKANLDLSKRRSQAVKQALVSDFSI